MSKDFYIMVRGWMDDDVFSSEPYTEREAFLYLVEKAAWKNRRYRSGNKIIQLKRGQFTGSLRYIAEAWQWNKDRVAAYLKILVNADMIQTETQTGQTVVTICKYSKYQDVHSKLQTAGRQRADSGQTKITKITNITKRTIVRRAMLNLVHLMYLIYGMKFAIN